MKTAPIVVIALLVAVGAGAAVIGDDVLPGTDGENAEPFPTATPQESAEGGSTDDSDSDSSGTDAAETSTPPFGFVIENIEECGTTCRDVTTTLTNQQDSTAEETTVYSRVFAGQEVDPDKEVWRGNESVGTLDAGESYTATRRVDLSYSEAFEVRNEDGWITIQTTVETADRTVTFTERRQVL
ncbi:hypothetical protein [Halobellus salinisoli]|uniref:hypothetical protein n=1 Tax=Halobellus salinisoli TaxID=3108500 RepID=UPI00300A5AC2